MNEKIVPDEQERFARELETRGKLLNSLDEMNVALLSQKYEVFDEVIDGSLKSIAEAASLDRVVIYYLLDPDSDRRLGQKYRWDKAQGGLISLDKELMLLPSHPAAEKWLGICQTGGTVNIHRGIMSKDESDFLDVYGVKSILLAPVITNDGLWGVVAFQDHTRQRDFSECAGVLNSVARLCANAIIRNENIQKEKQAMLALEHRERLLDALNKTAAILLSHEDESFNEVMSRGIKPVAGAMGLHRVAVYRLFGDTGRMGQIYLWMHGDTVVLDEELVELPDVPPVRRWLDVLKKGEYVHNRVGDVAEDQAEFMSIFGIKSILFVPIFTRGNFWGVITLENLKDDKYFNGDWIDFMRSAAHLCAGAVIRNENILNERKITKALEQREMMMRALSEASIVFLSCRDEAFGDMMTAGINLIAEAADLDRISIFKNLEGQDELHMSQIYRWEKKSGGTTAPREGLSGITYADFVPSWEADFKNGVTINSPVGGMPEHEAFTFKRYGTMSVFAVPILINNAFWGFVLFEDHRSERYFDMNAADMLQSAAFMCANTIMSAGMEREIKRANRLNHSILATMPMGVVLFDDKPRVIDCNDELIRMFDASKQQIIDRYFMDFMPEYLPDGRKSFEVVHDIVHRAIDGETIRFEWPHQTAAGVPVPCDIKFTRVKDEDEFIGLGFLYDLSYRKQMEQELIAAKESAERSSRYKSAFLANMSHEIRTPMNAILGITEIQLRSDALSSDAEDALEKIYESGNVLMGIINDILDLSKIEAGKMEILPVEYDIASLINDTVQLNRLRYDSKPIVFNLEIDENTPLNLIGDELRIKQILNNILSNAYKYTEKGEVSMSVRAEYSDLAEGSDATVVFKVSDTGQGMTEEQVIKLFDEYTRFNMDANRTTIGTGLGMSITNRLIGLMNGEILVESELGAGSVFTVRIPQKCVDSTVCGADLADKLRNFRFKSMSMAKKSQILREYMPYGSVLVVDDVESNIYVTKGMLLPYGLKIETALSGFAAIEKIERGDVYDIIFMDHMMPKMDGIEATKIIRGLGYTGYIIALTANALVGHAEMFMRNGFDGYIAKPIDSRELNLVLNDFIRNKKPPEVVEAARLEQHEKRVVEKTAMTDDMGKFSELQKFVLLDAKNAVNVFRGILPSIPDLGEADMETYAVTAHGMKSALANIGETGLSGFAYKLENAAKERDIAVIQAETRTFIDALLGLIEALEPPEETEDIEMTAADMTYLREKLSEIKAACAEFNANNARAALDGLLQKAWPGWMTDILDEISVHLLYSAFKKAVASVDKAIDALSESLR